MDVVAEEAVASEEYVVAKEDVAAEEDVASKEDVVAEEDVASEVAAWGGYAVSDPLDVPLYADKRCRANTQNELGLT